jgi:hypothetical protein
MITVVTVRSATAFPTFFHDLAFTGTSIGVIFMQMFFAASGAAGSMIRLVFYRCRRSSSLVRSKWAKILYR